MPERIDATTRRLVSERADFRCEYCLTPASLVPAPFAVEHIHPKSVGGGHSISNLAHSCPGCNGHKAAKISAIDPATGRRAPLFNPRKDKWKMHFQWASAGLRIEGIGNVGRATVVALNLNREGLVNLRRLMVIAGIHPPAIILRD